MADEQRDRDTTTARLSRRNGTTGSDRTAQPRSRGAQKISASKLEISEVANPSSRFWASSRRTGAAKRSAVPLAERETPVAHGGGRVSLRDIPDVASREPDCAPAIACGLKSGDPARSCFCARMIHSPGSPER